MPDPLAVCQLRRLGHIRMLALLRCELADLDPVALA
jgi:hypothetical protein